MAKKNGAEDVTVEILKQIRDEMRGMREGQAETNARLGVVETTMRDLAEQMLVLGRGVKVAIEHRKATDHAIHDHEKRITKLEKRSG